MSTTNPREDHDRYTIEAIPNEEDGTVTFASSAPGDNAVSTTQWITINKEDLVALGDQ